MPEGRAQSRRDGLIVAWHEVPGTAPPQKNRPVGRGMLGRGPNHRVERARRDFCGRLITPIVESVRVPARIRPYPTGRLLWGGGSQALRARLRSHCPSGTKAIRRRETSLVSAYGVSTPGTTQPPATRPERAPETRSFLSISLLKIETMIGCQYSLNPMAGNTLLDVSRPIDLSPPSGHGAVWVGFPGVETPG